MNTKKFISSVCILGISFLLIIALWVSGFFSYFDTALYDFLLGQKIKFNPRVVNARIHPIDLNDRSEMNLGLRLSDRSAFGDLFSVIAYSRASSVALDFIYSGDREQNQYMLDGALGLRSLITAVVPVPENWEVVSSYSDMSLEETALLRKNLWKPKESGLGDIPRARTFMMPFFEFGEIVSQLGHISVNPDPDGIYRRIPLFYAWEDGYIPAISLATALNDLGVNGNDIEIHHGKEVIIPLGPGVNISIPINSRGEAMVPYGGKWIDTTRRSSFDKIANARFDEEALSDIRNDLMGSICFVADTTFSTKDVGPSPFENIYILSGLHTWIISGILDAAGGEDTFFMELGIIFHIIFIFLFVAAFLLFGMINKDSLFNICSAAIFLLFTGLVLYLWFFHRFMPWYGAGSFAILSPWLFGFMYRFFTQRKRQTALERYVPRPVAQKLVAGQRTSLIPLYKELTILFSDISGFTTWSSDREAQVVHDFLNDYLESMADILFAHNATVDKFMGDGILAFFGDPLDIPDHAEQAVKAAEVMQQKIKDLREKWLPLVGINLKVRIGINTGKVIVGDLGTSRRIEYTVIGSAVNLAQRMESLAPPGGILITEFTKDVLEKNATLANNSPFCAFSGKKELIVKGYDKPVSAYEVIF